MDTVKPGNNNNKNDKINEFTNECEAIKHDMEISNANPPKNCNNIYTELSNECDSIVQC